MKIDGWHIDGFGVHADLNVTDLPDGLTIISGPNESGKTTLQHFLVGMLFGFPPVNRADHHPALRGGTYGGRLFVTDDTGQRLTIHRGARKSSLRVTHADGTAHEGDISALVGGASKELFQSIFSVHLADLAELRALTEDQVRDRVFSAGILGAGRSAQTALTQLATERDVLFKPGGRGERYRIKELRAQLADARLRLEAARRESQSLPAHLRELDLLKGRATTLGAEAEQLRAELGLVTAVADLWPRWSAATNARHKLDQLGPVPVLPADAGPRLHTSIGHHQSTTAAAVGAAEALAAAEHALAQTDTPTLTIDMLDQIDRLARQIDTERDRAHRVAELAVRAQRQREELEHDLTLLGTGRDLAWLDSHSPSASDASELRQAAGVVADARTDVRDAERALDQLTTDLAVEAADLDRAEAALAELPTLRPADALAGLDAATTLAALATQRELAVRRLAEAEARRTPAAHAPRHTGPSTPLLAAGGATLATALAALALGQPLAAAVVITIAIALAATGLATRTRDTAPTATDIDAVIELAADDVRRIDAELEHPLRILQLDHTPTAAEAAAIRAHADRLESGARNAEDERRRASEARARHHDRETRLLAAAAQRRDGARAQLDTAQTSWTMWLAARDLPTDLDPAGADEFLNAIGRARVAARTLRLTDDDLQSQRTAATAFAHDVASLATSLGELGVPDSDPIVLIEQLATNATEQRARHRALAEATAAVERAGLTERQAARAHAEASERLHAHLAAIGATAAEDGLALLERAATAAKLRTVIDDAEGRLDAAVAGSPQRRAHALELLATADPAAWNDQAQSLRNQLHLVTDDRDQCLHAQAAVQAEIDTLVTSADVPRCELRVAGLEAELVDAVTAWASLTLAHQMVEGTLAKYQRERQPDVVKQAAALFQQVTGGTYVRLEVRDNDVFAIDHAQREVPATALSQGTTEQLYLCMRIALAESFAKTTPLPLLLDDITVNADAGRQNHLTELLATVADTNQVFAFTCHDTVVDDLRRLRPDAKVITLQAHRAHTAPSGTGNGTISLAAG
jgi:uncharacterized protein YhaN